MKLNDSLQKFPGLAAFLVLLCGLVCSPVPARAAEASTLEAGVARVNLTPPLEMKAGLGGYGTRMSKPAVGVHDAVWAKALVLANGERKFALITADVLAFPPQFKAAVIERLSSNGWSADQIMLLPSHTHTSFDMMALHPGNRFGIPQVGVFHKELFEHTAEKLAAVIREAGRKLTPVVAGSTTVAVLDRNRNRRRGLTTHDTDLTVTRVDTRGGKPLAVLVNWTAHPTFMSEEDMLFSGDWPGHLQRTVEALIGQGVTAMFYNGAEGDQSPVPPAESASNWERAERYGRDMGIQAWRVWEKTQPREVKSFGFYTEVIALPKTTWHPDFMKTGGSEYGLNEKMMRGFLDALQPTQTRSTAFRLGDLVILGVPGEMAAQLGMEAKTKARAITGAGHITIGGLADEWVSYILPAEEYRKGGYEASVSFYGDGLGSVMVEGIIRASRGLSEMD
ncbi:MAG: neutral/alkaline non-lysosomal ceramidase N-terminal domain-containing protein [Verrucomicrobia bacterium]|nr:neutral/alkaline non-lysosomal ceramidase N-terminal domain-containing protein [Verrucomicrobiota bacterium]